MHYKIKITFSIFFHKANVTVFFEAKCFVLKVHVIFHYQQALLIKPSAVIQAVAFRHAWISIKAVEKMHKSKGVCLCVLPKQGSGDTSGTLSQPSPDFRGLAGCQQDQVSPFALNRLRQTHTDASLGKNLSTYACGCMCM